MERIGIVVLNYNDYQLTEKCVNNLIRLGIEYKVVIVDNNSKNHSFTYLKNAFSGWDNIDVIKNSENGGYSKGNNFGIKYLIYKNSDIEYISIINPDIEFTYRDILENLVCKLKKDHSLALIGANMFIKEGDKAKTGNSFWNIPTKKNLILEYIFLIRKFILNSSFYNIEIENYDNGVYYVDVVAGCFFIIKVNVFKEVGFFDENTFLYNEENILAIKLKRLGYREGISFEDYYIHKHKKVDSNLSLRGRIHAAKVEYSSRKVLCKYYKEKYLSILLKLAKVCNYIDILWKHVPRKIKNTMRG